MKNKSVVTNFPIWEKVYLDITPDFFENIIGIQIKNLIYIFSSIYDEKNQHFYILDLESESIKQEEMEFEGCFHPVLDKNNKIYLFRFSSNLVHDIMY